MPTPDITPVQIILDRGGADSAFIAEALLDMGVLKASDWCGSLDNSIAAGLSRWCREETQSDDIQGISLSLEFGNSLAKILDATDVGTWDGYGTPDKDFKAGAFALRVPTAYDGPDLVVQVGNRIEALNEIGRKAPGAPNAGWSVLAVIEQAVEATHAAITPHSASLIAEQETAEWLDAMEDHPEEEDMTRDPGWMDPYGNWYTLSDFNETLPEPARKPKLDAMQLRFLCREVEASPDAFPRWARTALHTAVDLLDLMQTTAQEVDAPDLSGVWVNEVRRFNLRSAFPILVGWNEKDWIGAAFDTYINEGYEGGTLNTTIFTTMFRFGMRTPSGQKKPKGQTIEYSIWALKATLRILRLLERLVLILDAPGKDNRNQQQTLIEVFDREIAARLAVPQERIRIRC